jgi:phage terminase Nu1 subunit (DNA packaging protein)
VIKNCGERYPKIVERDIQKLWREISKNCGGRYPKIVERDIQKLWREISKASYAYSSITCPKI